MVKLVMQDNTTIDVTYNYGAKVRQIKLGELRVTNPKLQAFCAKVKYVMFDDDKHSDFQTRLEKFKRDHKLTGKVQQEANNFQPRLPYVD